MVKLYLQSLIIHGHIKWCVYLCGSRSQLPRVLRRRSAITRLVRLWVRIIPGPWMYTVVNVVCCRYRSLRRADHSSRGIQATMMGFVCDLETSNTGWPWPALACNATGGRERGGIYAVVYGSSVKQQRIPCTFVCGYEMTEEISVYKPVWPHDHTLHYTQIPGIAVWLSVKPIRSCVTKFIRCHASYCTETTKLSSPIKWPGCQANHSPRSSTEAKNEWSNTSISLYVFRSCTKTVLP
jgi:hypothetical protein